MAKVETIHDRIQVLVDTFGGGKNTVFAEKVGVNEGNIRGYIKGIVPKHDFLEKVVRSCEGISPAWLLTGKGSMLLDDVKEHTGAPATKATSPTEGIPLIPFSAMAGALAGEQTALDYECERYVVPAFRNADFLMRVQGVSMQPTYLSGDIVACQRVPLSDIFFQWNKTYVLDTAQGALIKRVKPGKDDSHILIVSDNTQYDPFELSRSDIHAVALVIGLIRLE